ncbi:MAG: hypothetical protein COA90_06605 [Gammaproteobacteria bacterium]|nr:MAG: hypothetical protein COA90_06605 [Gammaproteobacteria bacterium]
MNKLLLSVLAAAFSLTASIPAFAHGSFSAQDHQPQSHRQCGQHQGGFGSMFGMPMHSPLESLDLSNEQKKALFEIHLEAQPNKEKRRLVGHELLLTLDPSASDYQQKVNDYAEQVAEQAKQRFLTHAKKKADINAVLTKEQRIQLKFQQQQRMQHDGKQSRWNHR